MSPILTWSTALVVLAWLANSIATYFRLPTGSMVKRPRTWLQYLPAGSLVLFALLAATGLLPEGAALSLGWATPPLQLVGLLAALAALIVILRAGAEMGDQLAPDLRVWAEQRLRTGGLFALVRHPLYLGTMAMWLAAGLGLMNRLVLLAWLVAIAPAYYLLARREEKLLVERFGESYRAYQAKVPMLLPLPRGKEPPATESTETTEISP